MKLMWLATFALAGSIAAQDRFQPPAALPASATTKLRDSLERARPHKHSVWRDTAPRNGDGSINAYIEIAKGDRRKWEFDIGANVRKIDRMMPVTLGGYPINYGIVPQTISFDGDPFDALVLGPPAEDRVVRGIPVGLMLMEDEKGYDSKVVLSPLDGQGRPRFQLTPEIMKEVGDFFQRYKQHEPGAFSRVPGWGSADEGVALVNVTHAYFQECRDRAGSACAANK
jgi:inorganic pyrophosphatase